MEYEGSRHNHDSEGGADSSFTSSAGGSHSIHNQEADDGAEGGAESGEWGDESGDKGGAESGEWGTEGEDESRE